MGVPRTPWGKKAITAMVDQEKSTKQVAEAAELSPQYTAAILYGRIDSPKARKKISSVLGISDAEVL